MRFFSFKFLVPFSIRHSHNNTFMYAVAFATGCGIGTYGDVNEGIWRWLLPCVVALCLLSAILLTYQPRNHRGLSLAFTLATAVLLGLTAYDLCNPMHREDNYIRHIEDATPTRFVAEVESEPQRTPKRLKTIAEVKAIVHGDSLVTTVGKAVVYFDTLATWVAPGARIMAVGEFQPLPDTVGTEGFRYRQYMERKGVVSQCFTTCIEPVEQGDRPTLRIRRWRNTLASIVNSSRLSPERQGIAKALVLGDRNAPNEITKAEFRTAGLSHLLCVSGLHVGVVALIVGLIFRPFGTNRRSRMVKGLAELTAVWLFVIMTDAAPSTLRAGTMFSFIIVGRMVTGRPGSLVALGLSALTLLMIRPTLIADIGFQFSYAAVTGIAVFYKPIHDLLPLKRLGDATEYMGEKLIRRQRRWRRLKWMCRKVAADGLELLWESTVVCTVAQVCVMPLTLYYFHQLTPWFLVANVLIVPFTGVLLGSIMTMMATSGWAWGWQAMTEVVDWELGVLCDMTRWVSALPGAMVEDVRFTLPMLTVAMLALTAAGVWVRSVEVLRCEDVKV